MRHQVAQFGEAWEVRQGATFLGSKMSEQTTINNIQKAVIFTNWFLKGCGLALIGMTINFYFGTGFTPFATLQAARLEQQMYEVAEGVAIAQDKADAVAMRLDKIKTK